VVRARVRVRPGAREAVGYRGVEGSEVQHNHWGGEVTRDWLSVPGHAARRVLRRDLHPSARRLHGSYTAVTRRLHGGYTAVTRQLHGGCAAVLRPASGSATRQRIRASERDAASSTRRGTASRASPAILGRWPSSIIDSTRYCEPRVTCG
jgi:hypothetical protein